MMLISSIKSSKPTLPTDGGTKHAKHGVLLSITPATLPEWGPHGPVKRPSLILPRDALHWTAWLWPFGRFQDRYNVICWGKWKMAKSIARMWENVALPRWPRDSSWLVTNQAELSTNFPMPLMICPWLTCAALNSIRVVSNSQMPWEPAIVSSRLRFPLCTQGTRQDSWGDGLLDFH